MLGFAKAFLEVAHALPIEKKEIGKLHRGYIANVIYTIVGDPFNKWVEQVMKERTKKIQDEQNQMMQMDAGVYSVFQASNSISGKS